MIEPWEAFFAGALMARELDGPAPFEIVWERDLPSLMRCCAAGARGDSAAIAAELRGADLRALLAIAFGVIGELASRAVERGEGPDVEGVLAAWESIA